MMSGLVLISLLYFGAWVKGPERAGVTVPSLNGNLGRVHLWEGGAVDLPPPGTQIFTFRIRYNSVRLLNISSRCLSHGKMLLPPLRPAARDGSRVYSGGEGDSIR